MANLLHKNNNDLPDAVNKEGVVSNDSSLSSNPLDHNIGSVQLKRMNSTGLPEQLKTGMESISGMRLDHVRVHYNSPKPAILQAHAYAQGHNIHVASGQEKHLPHELGHVVQQMQGRVKSTKSVGGLAINDSPQLEQDADTLGMRALNAKTNLSVNTHSPNSTSSPIQNGSGNNSTNSNSVGSNHPRSIRQFAFRINTHQPIQRAIIIKKNGGKGVYDRPTSAKVNFLIRFIDNKLGDQLKRGWKTYVRKCAKSKIQHVYPNLAVFIYRLKKSYKKQPNYKKKVRPNFPASSYDHGRVTRGIQTGKDESQFSPSANDAALPHRFPFAAIKESTSKFISGAESTADLIRWSDRLKVATDKRLAINCSRMQKQGKDQTYYKIRIEFEIGMFQSARKQLISAKQKGKVLTLMSAETQAFLKWTNALHGNIPDYGPHSKVNIPVSNRLHLHFESGLLTPGSHAAGSMTPTRSRGVAMTSEGTHLVTTDGHAFDLTKLHQDDANLLAGQNKSNTNISKGDLT